MGIKADSTTADLGVSSQVLSTKVGNKVVKTTTTTRDMGDSKKKRRRDGLPYIASQDDLRGALKEHASAPSDQLRQHITRRAYAIRATHLIPQEWRMTAENKHLVIPLNLRIVAEDARVEVINAENPVSGLPPPADGVMRVLVPFYIGGSVAPIGGFDQKLYFPADALPGIVAETNKQIRASAAPAVTSYARHAHAETAEHLPPGRVLKLEQRGSVGYGIVDIAPTQDFGRDLQILIAADMLHSVSLRASEYEPMTTVKINGELAYEARIKRIEGIDFAPDGPAMPTYGVQRLAAEASVEPVIDVPDEEDETTPQEDSVDLATLTLEEFRASRSDLVLAIEKPLADKVTELTSTVSTITAEKNALAEKVTKTEIAAEVAKIAALFPDPAAALAIVAEVCKDVKSPAEVSVLALPLVAGAYKTAGVATPVVETVVAETPAARLAALLAPQTAVKTIVAESSVTETEKAETYGGLAVPVR